MRKCQDWLKTYMHYTKASHSPDAFHFWTGVWTIASVLRRRVWIEERGFDWTPNHYILLVAPPGVASKGTTMGMGEKLLFELDDLDIHFAPSSLTWQSFMDAFAEATQFVDAEKLPDSLGGLNSGDIYEHSPITASCSEFGNFLDTRDQDKITAMIDFWDSSKPFTKRTRKDGEEKIKLPCLNLIAATQPGWLQRNVDQIMVEGGLFVRFIFVYGEKRRRHVAYPSLEAPSDEYNELRSALVHDLREIAQLCGKIKLTPEAYEFGSRWDEEIYEGKGRPSFLRSSRFDHYWARKQVHVHKLAIILAAARGEKFITPEILQAAITIVTANEPSLRMVFEHIGVIPTASHTQELAAIVERCPKGITSTELYQQVGSHMRMEDFQNAVRTAVQRGAWQTMQHPTLGIVYISENSLAAMKEAECA